MIGAEALRCSVGSTGAKVVQTRCRGAGAEVVQSSRCRGDPEVQRCRGVEVLRC